jgi:argonaute-like protein implicated in RNA metabolism and viral defense
MDKDMDLVYICRDGENEELRYSIRSAVNNLPHDKIWVVGGKPDWYTGNYIEVSQGRAKYTNARNSLKAICDSEEISESFILMNDDFYIINKVESVPYMYAGTLDDKIKQREDIFNGNTYTTLLRKTLGYLYRKKINVVLDYELHVPMVMEKRKLNKVLKLSGLWRSVYGNVFNVGGVKIRDVKVYDKKDKFYINSYDINNLELDYLSSNDDSFETIKSLILEERFPFKTTYEA